MAFAMDDPPMTVIEPPRPLELTGRTMSESQRAQRTGIKARLASNAPIALNAVRFLHGRFIHQRRVRTLSRLLADMIPLNARVLDVGCGDGLIDQLIHGNRPDVKIEGIDVKVRPCTHIPVNAFDGFVIPHPTQSFDVVMFVDVLHHMTDPMFMLREAARVARNKVIIKDHIADKAFDRWILRGMDWVGNACHDVAMPFNFWSEAQWKKVFASLDLTCETWQTNLRLYCWPANLIFGRSLHYLASLSNRAISLNPLGSLS
jgi:SAM-dependent methyltransferase